MPSPDDIPGLAPQIPTKCPKCNGTLKVGGPLWLVNLMDSEYVKRMLDLVPTEINTCNKALKLLDRCYEESFGPATFYDLHKVCKVLKTSAPPITDVIEKLHERDTSPPVPILNLPVLKPTPRWKP